MCQSVYEGVAEFSASRVVNGEALSKAQGVAEPRRRVRWDARVREGSALDLT